MKRDTLFISHSSSDADFAKRLAWDLRTAGICVWLDVLDIEPGADWRSSIEDALAKSSQLLVVWSRVSVCSPEVLIEVLEAQKQGKLILQAMIDDCKRASVFDQFQNIDFRHNYDEALGRLFEFLPTGRRAQRAKELAEILPANPYPSLPRMER